MSDEQCFKIFIDLNTHFGKIHNNKKLKTAA